MSNRYFLCVHTSTDPLAQQMLFYEKHCNWLAKVMGKDPESFSSEELQVKKFFLKLDCSQVHMTIKIMHYTVVSLPEHVFVHIVPRHSDIIRRLL